MATSMMQEKISDISPSSGNGAEKAISKAENGAEDVGQQAGKGISNLKDNVEDQAEEAKTWVEGWRKEQSK